jgi:hypothetical protein
MRFVTWLFAIAAGILLVLVLSAFVQTRDRRGETVAAGKWAQDICGTVGVWRGAMEAISEDVRSGASRGDLSLAEPQSQTPQSRSGFVRAGLGHAIEVTKIMVDGVDEAGTPDTAQGPQAERKLGDWARGAEKDLEDAQDALDREADSLEESIQRTASSAESLANVLVTGRQTITDVAASDPQLAAALAASSTCQHLQKDTGR